LFARIHSKMVSLTFPDEYKYVLFGVLAMMLEYLLIGGILVMRVRSRTFTKEYLKEFNEDHKKIFKQFIPKGGYPDNGNGVYGKKLPYADWVKMANTQRIHYNYLEFLAPTTLFLLVGGVGYPCHAALDAVATVVGRLLYTLGYTKRGASGRIIGAAIFEIALVYSIGLSVFTVYDFTN